MNISEAAKKVSNDFNNLVAGSITIIPRLLGELDELAQTAIDAETAPLRSDITRLSKELDAANEKLCGSWFEKWEEAVAVHTKERALLNKEINLEKVLCSEAQKEVSSLKSQLKAESKNLNSEIERMKKELEAASNNRDLYCGQLQASRRFVDAEKSRADAAEKAHQQSCMENRKLRKERNEVQERASAYAIEIRRLNSHLSAMRGLLQQCLGILSHDSTHKSETCEGCLIKIRIEQALNDAQSELDQTKEVAVTVPQTDQELEAFEKNVDITKLPKHDFNQVLNLSNKKKEGDAPCPDQTLETHRIGSTSPVNVQPVDGAVDLRCTCANNYEPSASCVVHNPVLKSAIEAEKDPWTDPKNWEQFPPWVMAIAKDADGKLHAYPCVPIFAYSLGFWHSPDPTEQPQIQIPGDWKESLRVRPGVKQEVQEPEPETDMTGILERIKTLEDRVLLHDQDIRAIADVVQP